MFTHAIDVNFLQYNIAITRIFPTDRKNEYHPLVPIENMM